MTFDILMQTTLLRLRDLYVHCELSPGPRTPAGIARCSKLVPIELLRPEGVVQGMEPAECFMLPLKERQRGGLSQALRNKSRRHVRKVKNRGRCGIILCFLGAVLLLLLLQLGHEPGQETKCVVRCFRGLPALHA